MCLSKLENFKVTQNYGWQVFRKEPTSELYPYFFGGDKPVPVGEWQKDKFRIFSKCICTETDTRYKEGYHIFLNEEDAKVYFPGSDNFCIRKVWFKRVVARGLQEIPTGRLRRQVKVVVCRKRFVEPDTGGENDNTP